MCSVVTCPRAKYISSQIIQFSSLSGSISCCYIVCIDSQTLQSCTFLAGNLLECEGDITQPTRTHTHTHRYRVKHCTTSNFLFPLQVYHH